MWTLAGRYIGTLGSPVGWKALSPNEVVGDFDFRIPPDLKSKISSTTLKVLNGGKVERMVVTKDDNNAEEITKQDDSLKKEKLNVYGAPLTEPILGKYFKLPPRSRHFEKPILDKSLPYVYYIIILLIRKTKLFNSFVIPDTCVQSLGVI